MSLSTSPTHSFSYIALSLILFFAMNGFSSLFHYRNLLAHCQSPAQFYRTIGTTLVSTLLLLFSFWLLGPELLRLLGIGSTHLLLASGFILIFISIKAIFPSLPYIDENYHADPNNPHRQWLYPLAVPLFIHPASIPILFLLSLNYFFPSDSEQLLTILLAWGFSALLLLFHKKIIDFFGDKLLAALQRLFGLILLLVGIELFSMGIKAFLNTST